MVADANNNLKGTTTNVKYAHDGAIIEGTGKGGQVLIVSKNPEFMRDIAPYFQVSVILIFTHILYFYTGNLCFAIWLMYLACPICNFILPEDNQNLSLKSERAFYEDKRFWIPLYAYNLVETLTWIWALIVFSDKFEIDHPFFQTKP